MEDLDALGFTAPIGESDLETPIEECRLSQPGGDRVVVELGGLLEGQRARPESDGCPGLLDRLEFLRVLGLGLAVGELLVIDVAPHA